MRVSTLYRSVPLLVLALSPKINAAYDTIARPYPSVEGAANSDSSNSTTGDVLPTPSERTHYRINGPGQLAMIYTELDCPRLLGAQELYFPSNGTKELELLQIEHCTARCMNLPKGIRGQSIELSLSGPIIMGERPAHPYARLYETTGCRGVGKEASVSKFNMKFWACTNVEDGFWNSNREGGFGSFIVWEGCRYLESAEQKEVNLKKAKFKQELERAKADIEKSRWEASDREHKIQKEEGKLEIKVEKQTQKERLKQWEKEQREKKKQDKQEQKEKKKQDKLDEKQQLREQKLREKERKAAWAAMKEQRKKDMKIQFEEWRQDRINELNEDSARERAERKAQRQKGKEERQAELLEMERQWEQDRRDKVAENDKEWEEQLASEAIEMARDEKEEGILEAAEIAAGKEENWAPKNRRRGVNKVPINRRPGRPLTSAWKWIGVDGF